MKQALLVVDDDENIRSQMKWVLADDYDVTMAADRPGALRALDAKPADVVLLDLGLPPHPNDPTEGFLALAEIAGRDPLVKVIVVTGQAEKENALKAIAGGAYDLLNKPVDAAEIRTILKRAFYVVGLERELRELQQQQPADATFQHMLGASPAILSVFAGLRKVASSDAPVLLLGESGTGKEMAAEAIHRLSRRKDGPFVPINCGAIPEALLESELFGHEKGSFTGAHAARIGRIETAAGGSLFLDEIGDLPPPLQVKLLRFLQDRTIERVGGREKLEVDVRVLAATNADLKQALADGLFREDLYYRLAVVVISLPPLRDRQGDVGLLAQAFLRRFAVENRSAVSGFTPKALEAMEAHRWPGNVREMENRIRRAVIMSEGPLITAEDLDFASAPAPAYSGLNLKEAREAAERDVVLRALRLHGGTMSRAAAALGISRPTLYEVIEKLGIQREGLSG